MKEEVKNLKIETVHQRVYSIYKAILSHYSQEFTKNKERIQKFKETENSRYIYQSELDKACFQHDMAYEDFKDLPRRTASDNILRGKQLILLKIQNIMRVNMDLLQ